MNEKNKVVILGKLNAGDTLIITPVGEKVFSEETAKAISQRFKKQLPKGVKVIVSRLDINMVVLKS